MPARRCTATSSTPRRDAERRAGPQPPIDRNSYARENGWAIASLAALYDVTGDAGAARRGDDAPSTGRWPTAARPTAASVTRRAADDDTHLGDTLADRRGGAGALSQHRRAALSRAGGRARRGDRARSSRSRRAASWCAQPEPGREGRAGQAGEAGRRERGHGRACSTCWRATPAAAGLQRRRPSTACAT